MIKIRSTEAELVKIWGTKQNKITKKKIERIDKR